MKKDKDLKHVFDNFKCSDGFISWAVLKSMNFVEKDNEMKDVVQTQREEHNKEDKEEKRKLKNDQRNKPDSE